MKKNPDSLVKSLFPEAFQTERSAIKHPKVEAERLGACPPADAFLAVAEHAEKAEKSLQSLAKKRGTQISKLGLLAGDLFSISRDYLADFGLTAEKSYRGTLIGMRHGYDLMSLFGMAARAEGDVELASWCDEWLKERGKLIDAARDALDWFAQNPARAMANAKTKA